MKIGLTGSIACGKSTVAAFLRSLGHPVVDADAISRALTAPGGRALPAIREAFGNAVFDGDTLNRGALSAVVFADPAQRKRLNDLLHPIILAEIREQLDGLAGSHPIVFADVPLLYECSMADWFDAVWVASVPRDVQIARILERDGLTRDQAIARIDSQMPLAEKERLADAVIHTDGPLENTQSQVRALLAGAERSLT